MRASVYAWVRVLITADPRIAIIIIIIIIIYKIYTAPYTICKKIALRR